MSRTKQGRELPKKEEAPEVPEDKGSSEDETTTEEEIEDGDAL
jgi:hypothetical protein